MASCSDALLGLHDRMKINRFKGKYWMQVTLWGLHNFYSYSPAFYKDAVHREGGGGKSYFWL